MSSRSKKKRRERYPMLTQASKGPEIPLMFDLAVLVDLGLNPEFREELMALHYYFSERAEADPLIREKHSAISIVTALFALNREAGILNWDSGADGVVYRGAKLSASEAGEIREIIRRGCVRASLGMMDLNKSVYDDFEHEVVLIERWSEMIHAGLRGTFKDVATDIERLRKLAPDE